jgi:hypothetical protein
MAEKAIDNQTHKKNKRMDLQLHSFLTSKTRLLKAVTFRTGSFTAEEINLWPQDDGTDAKAKRKIPVPTENRTSVNYVQSSVLVNTIPESSPLSESKDRAVSFYTTILFDIKNATIPSETIF